MDVTSLVIFGVIVLALAGLLTRIHFHSWSTWEVYVTTYTYRDSDDIAKQVRTQERQCLSCGKTQEVRIR